MKYWTGNTYYEETHTMRQTIESSTHVNNNNKHTHIYIYYMLDFLRTTVMDNPLM